MKSNGVQLLTRVGGIVLIAAGVAGLIFSVVGLVVLARVEQRVEPVLMEQMELIDRTLAATADGLAVAETSLAQAVETTESLETTVAGVGQAIGDTGPMVESVADLLDEQLPATIKSTQDALMSVAASAKVVDDVLAVMTAIPFVGTDKYDPETPLQQSLEEVAASLDEIPNSLGAAQEGLTATSGNLEGLEEDFATMADNIGQIATSLESAQSVLVEYQLVVADLQTLAASVRQGLPEWLRLLRLAFSLVLIWLGIAQIGLLTQGWELIGRSHHIIEEVKSP